jgi:hypothetical protein
MNKILTLLEKRAALMREVNANPGWKYRSFEELVLDCGREMQPDENSWLEQGLPKSCYWNCQQLVSKQPELIYCEGFAASQDVGFPLAHAWLLNTEGKVLEPTWDSPGEAYLGIAFSWEWVRALLKSRRQQGKKNDLSVFECNFLEKFSLLKEGLSPDAYYPL